MKSELIDRMRAALDAMDPVTRTVFERVRLDGRDYVQIANELGLTIREVEQRFADALLQIWRQLDRTERP
jgi:DNA-directed RNA polymerase specialized sigma24 family protein